MQQIRLNIRFHLCAYTNAREEGDVLKILNYDCSHIMVAILDMVNSCR